MAEGVPDVVLEAVAFNWNTASVTDGLNLRRNGLTPVVLPEWREGYSTRPEDSPAAYSIADTAGYQITIQARFRRNDPGLHTIEIRAIESHEGHEDNDLDAALADDKCGNVLGRVRPRSVTFGAGGQTPMEPFDLEDVRLQQWGVGVRTLVWRWQYRTAGHSWKTICVTQHRIYSVLNIPTLPWQQQPFVVTNQQLPWTDVLDYACAWASGANSVDKAAGLITRAIYQLGPSVLTYDCPGGGSTHYSFPDFDCTAFLERIGGGLGLGYYVNCTDCATITSTFANAVGCDLWQSRMGSGFALNELLGIGSTTWQTCCGWPSFNYHEVAWEGACTAADDVYDACLQVDGDADPTAPPHTALLPVDLRFGNPSDGTYRDRLAAPPGRANCNPQPTTRVRRSVS
jgi:hypothetical protein